jgi:gas vesicle protein
MGNFLRGLLFGIGIGLLIAPMRGEEMRNLLNERISELRNSLPANDQLDTYRQQVTDRVSQTANNLRGYASQAATTVKSTANTLSNIGQNAASEVKSTGQDVANTTKNATNS